MTSGPPAPQSALKLTVLEMTILIILYEERARGSLHPHRAQAEAES